jgi:hypothetical protein
MMRVHRFTDEQAKTCDMDEETKRIQRERKLGRQLELSA